VRYYDQVQNLHVKNIIGKLIRLICNFCTSIERSFYKGRYIRNRA